MRIDCRPVFALFAVALIAPAHPAFALDFKVGEPIVHDNMAVYPIKGSDDLHTAPLTIAQAAQRGLIQINGKAGSPVTIDNHSAQSVFVPFGTLLVGGSQDQVVGTTTLIPPHGHNVPLDVYCVDPFRMAPRGSASAATFSTSGILIPSRTAKLSMLLGSIDSNGRERLRQAGVWWGIDTLRSRLELALGMGLKPARSVTWSPNVSSQNPATAVLASRESTWTDSLPLALSDQHLAQSQASYMRAFGHTMHLGGNVIGAVFAINGKLAGGETFRSSELFRQMWPHLVRAYATEAIAAKAAGSGGPSPSVASVKDFLSRATTSQSHDRKIGHFSFVRDTQNELYFEGRDEDGWVEASYLPKTLPERSLFRPDDLAVDVLEQGTLNGRSVDSLRATDALTFARDSEGIWALGVAGASVRSGNYAPVAGNGGQVSPPLEEDSGTVALALAVTVLLSLAGFAWFGRERRTVRLSRIGVSIIGMVLRTFRWMRKLGSSIRRGWAVTTAILNRPLIPSPLALLRGCLGLLTKLPVRRIILRSSRHTCRSRL